MAGRIFTANLLLLLVVHPHAQSADRPNVVIILADDLGYGDVQALNDQSRIPTPNLNQLAADGMTFPDAHSPSAVCTPTRYGLLTGRYCWRSKLTSGVLRGYSAPLIESNRRTIADLFQDSEYQTAAIGKWHLGMQLPMKNKDADRSLGQGDPGVDFSGTITDSPIHHGFDDYFGISASLDMPPYVYIRNDRFTMLPTEQQPAIPFPHFVRQGPRATDFVIADVLDRLTKEATDFIKSSSDSDRPFFLYMPLTGPHKPTQPHARFQGKTALNEYGDFVHQVDWTVGKVLKAIEEVGATDNTLVFFTSDNGSYMRRTPNDQTDHVSDSSVQGYHVDQHEANRPWRGTKADVWEAGHRVPFFVKWPQHIMARSSCDRTITHTDIFATCAEVLSKPLLRDEAEDSLTFLDCMKGNTTVRPAPVINHSAAGIFAIREGQWKLVAGNGSGGREKPRGKPFEGPYQLFNLATDPSEKHNLAAQNANVVDRLTEFLNHIREAGRSR